MSETIPLASLLALEVHPFADAFPFITGDETLELAQDIETNGLLNPVVVWGNVLLDGRNRRQALAKTTFNDVPVTYFQGTEYEAVEYVRSINILRRHMSVGQKAMVALAFLPYEEAEAERRMVEGRNQHSPKADPPQGSKKGQARDFAAAKFNINGRRVSEAKALELNAPDLAQQVRDGMALDKATGELKRRQAGPRSRDEDMYERFEKRIDRAVSSISDAIADLGKDGRPDDLRYVTEQLQGLLRQAERTF